MTTKSSLSVRGAITTALFTLSALFAVSALHNLWALRSANTSLQAVNQEIRLVLNLSDALNHSRTARVWLVQAAALTTVGQFDAAKQAIQTAESKLQSSVNAAKAYESAEHNAQEQPLVQAYMQAYQRYVDEGMTPLFVALRKNDALQYINVLRGKTMELDQAFEHQLSAALAYREDQAKALNTQAQQLYQQGVVLQAVLMALFGGMAVLLWLGAQRYIVAPLKHTRHLLDRVAHGQLSAAASTTAQDRSPREVAEMQSSLYAMQDKLRHIIDDLRSTAEQVTGASEQISSGTQDLAQRTEQQASNLQQTAASMEEMSASVKQNASTAAHANTVAHEARELALQSGQSVTSLNHRMGEMANHAHKITAIIEVINGIAFQTNVLALNAAVEAARAGDQGKGFSVVASEVRALAKRSADAAAEVKHLIESTVSAISTGTHLSTSVQQEMEQLVQKAEQVSSLVHTIATSSQEQSHNLEQVSTAVSSLDQFTQQNAALVEHSSASAQSLRHQAQALTQSVRAFSTVS